MSDQYGYGLAGVIAALAMILGKSLYELISDRKGNSTNDGTRITLRDINDGIHAIRGEMQAQMIKQAVLEQRVSALERERLRRLDERDES